MFLPNSKKNVRKPVSEKLRKIYAEKYHLNIDTSFDYVPTVVCSPCYHSLIRNRVTKAIPTIPMIWNEPNLQHSDCYACLCPSFQYKKWEERKKLNYPDYPETSSRKAVWASTRERSPLPGNSSHEDQACQQLQQEDLLGTFSVSSGRRSFIFPVGNSNEIKKWATKD